MSKAVLALFTSAWLIGLAPVHAQTAAPAATDTAQAMTEGEVRRIDKVQGKVTLRHGEIKNLEMPPMTMVFKVQDAAALDKLKVGDKVKFRADKSANGFVVTAIQPAQ
jgi:Cu/Ag efflux protein CusF